MEDNVWLKSNGSQDQLNHKDSSRQGRVPRGCSAVAMDSKLE
jgi:hypothetical protein